MKITIQLIIMTIMIAGLGNNLYSQVDKIKEADKEYHNKNYEKSRQLYLESLKSIKDSAKINSIRYKVGLCLAYMKDDSEFNEFIDEFRKSNIGNFWEARSYYLDGLYQANHYTYSRSAGAESFDKARELYPKYLKSGDIPEEEYYLLDALLVDRLEQSVNRYYYLDYDKITPDEEYKMIQEKEKESLLGDKKDYSSLWEARKKIVYLYKELGVYYQKDKEKTFLVKYDFANYLRRVSRTDIYKGEYKKLFNDITANSKDPELVSKTYLIMGIAEESLGNYNEAVDNYEIIVKKFPKSKWSNDAKQHIQEIKRPQLNLFVKNQFYLLDTVNAELNSKNIKNVDLKIFEIDFPGLLKASIEESVFDINNLKSLLSDEKRYKKFLLKEVFTWNIKTSYKNDFKYCTDKIEIPDRIIDGKKGQYLIIANSENIKSTALIIISDLVMISRTENPNLHFWTVNSESGDPVENVNIFTRFAQYDRKPKVTNGKTGISGDLFVENPGNYTNVIVAAYKEKSFAATNDFYLRFYGRNEERISKYTITDRPVYRPGQTVYFKHILKSNSDGLYVPVKNKKVKLILRDSKYQEVYKKELITNEFGSIYDKFVIPDDAPLGIYNFSLLVIDLESYENYTQGFRVEEYKRPEYQVKIESVSEKLKLGQNLKIKISADYYYGAPVANAEVEYTVKRSRFRPYQYFSSPYDWLYRGHNEFYYNYWWYYDRLETVVEHKTAKLNNEGFIILNYETESIISKDWDFDFEYFVEAKVTDESRRVIENVKNIIVPKREFNVFIKNERGYLTPNENARFVITALTNDNQPKNAAGIIRVYKLTPVDSEKKYDSLLIKKDSFSISKNKNEYYSKFPESGKYKIEFETQDVDKEKVFSELFFYVADSKFSGKSYYFDKMEIIPDKESYLEGETMKLLINSEVESPTIWLSFEAENKIFESKILKIDGKSSIVEYQITKKDVPNIFIKAFLVKGNRLYSEDKQVMIPPERQIIKMEVSSNKTQYEPGEKITLKVKTLDYAGKPMKSEVAISVFDASLLYIQDFIAQDIKKFFYGNLRYDYIQTNTSIDLNVSPYTEDFNKYKQFKVIGYPDGYYRVSKFLRYYKDAADGDEESMAVGAVPSPMAQKSVANVESMDYAMKEAPRGEGESARNGAGGKKNERKEEQIAVRENFAESLYWNPILETDEKGIAEISFPMNDALTKWKVESKCITANSEVGDSSAEFVSKKDFMIRLQAPRFLQERDEVTISAVINNYTSRDFNASAWINYDKNLLTLLNGEKVKFLSKKDKAERIDWLFRINQKGRTDITIKAEGNGKSDAVKIPLPILEYGIEKTLVVNKEMRERSSDNTEIEIPKDIRPGTQSLQVVLNPTLATVALSALPYLIEYPYGCFEQTINRFVPISVVSKTMKDLNIDFYDLEEFNQKMNKNYLGSLTKVFNKKEISNMTKESLKKIYDFQNSDGSFSWWKGYGADLYMTSLGVSSLTTALQMGVEVRQDVIERAAQYLNSEIKVQENVDLNLQAYILYAVSVWKPELIEKKALDELFRLRDNLTYYSLSLLGITYKNVLLKEIGLFENHKKIEIKKDSPLIEMKSGSDHYKKLKIIVSNILDRMKSDNTNNTAYWKPESGYYWRWYNDRIETSAMALKLINSVDPNNENLSKIVRWIINNRRGNTWYSTKDTGLMLEVLMEYIKTQGELDVDYSLKVSMDGKKVKDININKENIFTFNNKINIDIIQTGKHVIAIEKKGKGNLNYSVITNYFSKEDSITSAGNEIFVEREYFRLVKENVKKDNVERIEYKEIPIKNNETLQSGDEIRVKLHIESKNDYEYLIFEDRKPSGAEFTLIKSWGGYMELRDEKAVFFKNYLPQGKTDIQYDMRAEIPGKFFVMPTIGYAMYVPDIKANSKSIKINIVDKK